MVETDGGGGGREWWGWREGEVPSLSSSHFVSLSLSCIIMPGVSELGWDELGVGDAHCSSFGCHITCGNMAPASLVSIGRFCVCVHLFVFVLGGVIVVKAVVFVVGSVVVVSVGLVGGCQAGRDSY